MELKEEEAQVCRLCGQRESIYIDVFGEEGTKRLLGLKIHSKINILVKRDDGLPQIVCVRCLGTLEFLCDFYDRCHRTQKELSSTQSENTNEVINLFHTKNDAESDKENALPLRKTNLRSIENFNEFLNVKSSTIKEAKEANDKRNRTDASKSEKNASTGFCKKRNATIAEIADSNIIYRRKDSRKATLRVTKDSNRRDHSSAMRKTERKNWLNGSLVDTANLTNKDSRDVKTNYSRIISSHDNSNETKTEALTFFKTVDVINNQSIVADPSSSSSIKASILSNVIRDTDKNKLNDGNVDVLSATLKYDSRKSDIILKKEKVDDSTSHQIQILNQFVWMPNETLLQEPRKPKSEKDEILSNTSPPPGDEAGPDQQVDADSTTRISTSRVSDFVREECFSEHSETIVPEIINERSMEAQLSMDDEQGDRSENAELKVTKELSFNGRKSKEGGFRKISELISDEQKLEIEKYYRVDMSVVDSKAVLKNLTVMDKKNIRCNICGTLYPRLDKCQVHVWGHLKMRPFKCTACEFSTVTVSNVRCHIRKSHLKIKPFACHLCEKRYVTAVLLQEHLNTHTGARPFKCKICDFASSSRQVLSYHNTTHKPVKDIHCKVCGKEFYSRGRMRAHMLIHNKDKVVICKLCSAYLSNTAALEQHMKNIHTRDYICNICGKNLKSRKTLLNHKNVHAAAKYKCDLCPNVYKSSHILKEHLLKHEGIRKYKCNVCEKSFAQQSHLAAHMAVHSEIRYHCPGCNKAFNRQDNMKIHTKRCVLFLSNPELKNLLKSNERNRYVRKSNNSITMDASSVTKKTDDSERENEENISLRENSDNLENDKATRIKLLESNDACVTMHENSTVIENVLSSDRF